MSDPLPERIAAKLSHCISTEADGKEIVSHG